MTEVLNKTEYGNVSGEIKEKILGIEYFHLKEGTDERTLKPECTIDRSQDDKE